MKLIKCILLAVYTWSTLSLVQPLPREIKVGVLHTGLSTTVKLDLVKGGITRAFEDVNNSTDILNDTNLKFMLGDSGCKSEKAIGAAVDMYNADVRAYVGPACSTSCKVAGLLSTSKGIPMVSYSCSSLSLSDKDQYPYFARTKPYVRTGTYAPKTLVAIAEKYNWKHMCIIERLNEEIYTPVADATVKEFKSMNYTVIREQYNDDIDFNGMKLYLERIMNKCRSKSLPFHLVRLRRIFNAFALAFTLHYTYPSRHTTLEPVSYTHLTLPTICSV